MSMGATITDLDIFRSAQVLVKRHGEDAPVEAAMRADAVLEGGDLDGYAPDTRTTRNAPDRVTRDGYV